jgi:hypothetical protein
MERLALTLTLLASVLGALWVALDINRGQRHRTWPAQWALLWWATRDAIAERWVGWLVTLWFTAASFLDISPVMDAFGKADELRRAFAALMCIAAVLVGLRTLITTLRAIAGGLDRDEPVRR